MFCHDVQLVFSKSRQQILRQNQGVHICRLKIQPRLLAARPDKANIKLRIVGRQGAAIYEFQKIREGVFRLWSVFEHLVGDTCQTNDFRCQTAVWIHKGLKPLCNLSISQHHRADLSNGLPVNFQAGGLDVKADNITV